MICEMKATKEFKKGTQKSVECNVLLICLTRFHTENSLEITSELAKGFVIWRPEKIPLQKYEKDRNSA